MSTKPEHPNKEKSEVNYRRSTGQQRCGNCGMFHAPGGSRSFGSCDLVKGAIHAEDVCDRWIKR